MQLAGFILTSTESRDRVLESGNTNLGLKKTAFEEHQSLPLELVNQLAQTHAEILVSLRFLLQDTSGLFIRETFLKAAQDIDVCELALGEPCLSDYTEALSQHAKELGAVCDDDNRFLHG